MSRKLKSELADLIMARIPLEQSEMKAMNPNLLVSFAAHALEGVFESGGNNRGKVVEMIQYTVDNHAGDAWCMSSQQACVRFAELITGVESPLYPSGHCKTVFDKSPLCQWHPPMTWHPSLMVVWLHGAGPNGHVGRVHAFYKNLMMLTSEGNTSPGRGINPDGDGYYHRMRKRGGEGDMKEYGFLIAFPNHPTVFEGGQ